MAEEVRRGHGRGRPNHTRQRDAVRVGLGTSDQQSGVATSGNDMPWAWVLQI